MKHYGTLLVLMAGLLLAAPAQSQKNAAPKKKPNIIFILTDDLGYGDLGVLFQQQRRKANQRHEPWAATPYLDQMAAQGAVLSHHYCAAPVCAPSRASFLSGLSQGHANVRDNQFDKALENNHNVATVLRQAGYATAAIGKWGLQGGGKGTDDWPAHPLNRGFDYYLGYMRHGDGHEHYPKEGLYRGAKQVWLNRSDIAPQLDKCYTGDLWTAAAKKWIVDHKQGKRAGDPFFMYLAYDTPHAVLELPTQSYPAGGGLKGGLQWLGKPGQMINTASGKIDSWTHPDYAKATYDHDKNAATPEVAWPEVYQRYATSIRRIDDSIGDLMALLKDLKIDSNTLIVFTSDNGPSLESYLDQTVGSNSPDFFNSFGPFDGVKRDVLEGGVRVPTLAWWPGTIPAKRQVNGPNASHDWLTTFAAAAGVPAPARTDGVSLLPALTGKGKQVPSLVYVEYFNKSKTPQLPEFSKEHQGKVRNQMQLIRFGDLVGLRYDIQSAADDFEIYNVVKDPDQRKNLAGEAAMESLQKQMKEKVLQVRRPDASAPRPYDQALVPALADRKTKAGLSWQAFAGRFPWVPQISELKPSASGQAARLDAAAAGKTTPGLLYYEGYLRVPQDGEYAFYLNAGGGAVLRLHEANLIDADHGYAPGSERQAKVLLKAGLHPFRLYYTPKAGVAASLDLQWQGPGLSRQQIPATAFCQAVN
ncbi:MAG: sulfatase-like hydrolase/transferase [Adhaeribacter sp.]